MKGAATQMAVKAKAQAHMDDKFLEDPELEQLLEDRESAKAKADEFHQLDKKAKGTILALNLDGERRCGRFVISTKDLPARSVESFETKPGVRVNIKATSDGTD